MKNIQKLILVVEDDKDLREILSDHLKKSFNHVVIQAEDGEEAINLIFGNKPDLILLDLLLPKIDGFGVLEKIRSSTDERVLGTKVIVLSNLWSNKDILRAQALKIEEYYVKANTNLEDVVKKIGEII